MQIKLHNITGGVFATSGPQVNFQLGDTGQANVVVHIALSDGTHFHFPDGSPAGTPQSTVLPQGDYTCVVLVAAFDHGSFGRSFQSTVSIAGTKVASAAGSLPAGTNAETDTQAFILRVS
jgi:hypothetical protein